MKIFITGSTGFIGKEIMRHLRQMKCQIVELLKSNINLKDKEQTKNKIEKLIKGCDAVIHLAGKINSFDKNIFEVNVELTRIIVGLAKKHKIKKFIFLSTENMNHNLKDNYTESKRQAEQIVKTLKSCVIFRPNVVYGKNDTKYVSQLIQIIKKYPIVPVFGNGRNKVQFLYVDDLADCIRTCLKKNTRGTFTLAGPEPLEYNEVLRIMMQKLNKKRLLIHIPYFILMPLAKIYQSIVSKPQLTTLQLKNFKKDRKYNISQIKKRFMYNPTSFEQGIERTLR